MSQLTGQVHQLKWNPALGALFVWIGETPTFTQLLYVLIHSDDDAPVARIKQNMSYGLMLAYRNETRVTANYSQSEIRSLMVSPLMLFAEKNVQVSFDVSPNNARSESMLAVNPKNAAHMVGASKRFTNPQAYIFDIAAYVTQDGGMTWKESRPTPPAGVTGISDPTLAFDDQGNVYLVALPYTILGPNMISTSGIAIYQSTDGGLTWSAPKPLINLPGSDKQDVAGDGNGSGRSGFPGRVYAAWDAVGLAFARTVDHGATWVGPGNTVAGTAIPGVTGNFSPALAVGGDGVLYIAWLDPAARAIKAVKSTDGGQTFVTNLPNAATNISPVGGIPGAKFRVAPVPTACAGNDGTLLVAWADIREGPSRIYYTRTTDGGMTWGPSASGAPLVRSAIPPNQFDFHPQLASINSQIGCAFYRYGPKPASGGGPGLIDVIALASGDDGASFPAITTVTDQPWDPTIDAPFADANPNVTFIGDYFGLAASAQFGWFPFWTDTRTGIQEIWTTRVHY